MMCLAIGGYWARYIKMVDRHETTITFLQEIYDGDGRLVAVHEKFPEDRGHRDVEANDDGDPADRSE